MGPTLKLVPPRHKLKISARNLSAGVATACVARAIAVTREQPLRSRDILRSPDRQSQCASRPQDLGIKHSLGASFGWQGPAISRSCFAKRSRWSCHGVPRVPSTTLVRGAAGACCLSINTSRTDISSISEPAAAPLRANATSALRLLSLSLAQLSLTPPSLLPLALLALSLC